MSVDLDALFAVPERTARFGREALDELDAILGDYFALTPYERVEEPDPESGGKFIKYVQRIPFPSNKVDRKGTEALLRLKDAFDQMAWASARALDSKIKDTDTVYFPWADSAEGVKARLSGKSGKIPPELWPTYLRLKPHCTGQTPPTGDDACRILANVANRKHSISLSIDVQKTQWSAPGPVVCKGVGDTIDLTPDIRRKSKKGEIVVALVPTETEFQNGDNLTVHITFNKPNPLHRANAPLLLRAFSAKAKGCLKVIKKDVAKLI